ncbi:hypothetical protein BH09PLA1_BH09PLA1_08200 [soil metagenome]
MMSKILPLAIALGFILSFSAIAAPRVRPAPAAGMVNLPYTVTDTAGNQWMIYQGGWMQQRGNQPVYSQSAMLQINGNGIQNNTNQAKLEEKTGEVVFENMNSNVPGVTITRRVLVDAREGYLRYIDIFHNAAQQEQSLNYMIQSNLNFGVTAANYITEPGGKARQLGWAASTPAGRGAVELFAGKGAKVIPSLNWQQGSNFIQATLQLAIPPGKDIAIMHLHTTSLNPEAGAQAMLNLRESKILANVPAEIRRSIVNFNIGASFFGDREVLRGDVLDVVELRGGDQLKGTIKEPALKLATFYGEINLPSEKVLGLLNVGQFRPRQLVVSSDGEVFGGRLSKDTIELELSSGQTTQIPLSQILRIGWRKRATESDDPMAAPEKPMLALRSGDRIVVEIPAQPIDVATRYGMLKLQPQTVAAIVYASEDIGVHQIFLTDGSHFAGLVSGDQFAFKLAGGAGGQAVSLPASSLSRLQISTKDDDSPDDSAATMALSNDDLLVGALVGELKLDTAFDTITLNAPEIKSLTRTKDGGTDVQIELWDQSRVSGNLQAQELSCALASGITIKVPVMMIEQYSQPLPQPSSAMIDQIKKLVGELGADDWKQREQAESQLSSMGVAVIATLKQMRPEVGPEAQQRIDSVLRQVEAKKTKPAVATPAVTGDE